MAKLLLIHSEREVRGSLNDHLSNCGYEIKEASSAKAGLELGRSEKFDGVLLDAQLPSMGSWQLLADFKEDVRTKFMPVLMLTSSLSVQEESTGLRLGASHFITKPWNPQNLELTIKVALRDSRKEVQKNRPSAVTSPVTWPDERPRYHPSPASPDVTPRIGSGGKLKPLDEALSGGIVNESLTLLEGDSGTGKSVLCQYLIYGAILGGRPVEFFSTEHTVNSLAQQMSSLGLSVSDYLRNDTIGVYRIPKPSGHDDPWNLLDTLAQNVERVQPGNRLTIIDGITDLVQISQDQAVMSFFIKCQRMCRKGRTIVLTARLSGYDQNMLTRLHGVCDNLITIATESIRDRFVNTLEVPKVSNAAKHQDNRFSFQVESVGGIKIFPLERFKA